MSTPTIKNNTAQNRYELVDQDHTLGVAEYQLAGNVITLTHTEIAPEHGGKGYGSVLARQVLEDVKRRQQQLIPACGFIAAYIEKHPKYAALLARQD